MADWKYRINIKQYLSNDDSREAVVSACIGVKKELKKIEKHFGSYLTYRVIVDEFDDVEIDECADVIDFNNVLCELYDFADANRIWLGL